MSDLFASSKPNGEEREGRSRCGCELWSRRCAALSHLLLLSQTIAMDAPLSADWRRIRGVAFLCTRTLRIRSDVRRVRKDDATVQYVADNGPVSFPARMLSLFMLPSRAHA